MTETTTTATTAHTAGLADRAIHAARADRTADRTTNIDTRAGTGDEHDR